MPTSCLFLALAAVTLTLTLAVGCDRQRTLTEDEAEEEFGADCDAIYDDCVAQCDNQGCENACDAAKDACERQ